MKAALGAVAILLLLGCSGSSVPVAQPTAPTVLLVDSGAGSSGHYDSLNFKTAGDWKITWAYDCSAVTNGHDWLILGVYLSNGTGGGDLFDELTPLPGDLYGMRLETASNGHGPSKGTFFIRVVTECTWHLRVVSV